MRRVTRAQLLAGVQPSLALAPGALLGRTASGVGSPEVIAVGANLQLRDGVLSGSAPFNVGRLPQASSVSAADMVSVSQGGRDASVPVGAILAGLAGTPGLDVSGQVVRIAGGVGRPLADWAADAVPVEAFGAVGDGVTDDSAAIDRAAASGAPVRFGPRTYVLNGQWTVTQPVMLVGVPGRTVLRRKRQVGGAWISAGGARFSARGIVFDAGALGGESWGVLVGEGCRETLVQDCVFQGASGGTLGCGLVIQARDGLSGGASQHVVRGCEFSGNAGPWALDSGGGRGGGGRLQRPWERAVWHLPRLQRPGISTACAAWAGERVPRVGEPAGDLGRQLQREQP